MGSLWNVRIPPWRTVQDWLQFFLSSTQKNTDMRTVFGGTETLKRETHLIFLPQSATLVLLMIPAFSSRWPCGDRQVSVETDRSALNLTPGKHVWKHTRTTRPPTRTAALSPHHPEAPAAPEHLRNPSEELHGTFSLASICIQIHLFQLSFTFKEHLAQVHHLLRSHLQIQQIQNNVVL